MTSPIGHSPLQWLSTLLLAGFVGSVVACDPDPVRMSLLVYEPDDGESTGRGEYRIETVTLETLEDIERLEGRATKLRADAEITVDYVANTVRWERSPRSVAFSAFDDNGVLVPEDYDSLAMASIYYNLERSMLFFERIGLPNDAIGTLPTYYWPKFTIVDYDGTRSVERDNAFYMFMSAKSRAFFILPFELFQWIPVPLNAGIITHEYTHAVFDVVVWQSDRAQEAMTLPSTRNFLYGINEGSADFMAVARTGDPDFISHSIPKGTFAAACNNPFDLIDIVRDASNHVDYDESVDAAARNAPPPEFCPYDVGTFWAALLYEISQEISGGGDTVPDRASLELVAGRLLEALWLLGGRTGGDVDLTEALSLFVGRFVDTAELDAICDVIERRYSNRASGVEGC